MITRLVSLVFLCVACCPKNSYTQELETGMYTCLSDYYTEKGHDWKATCDSVILYLRGNDSLAADKKTVIINGQDSTLVKNMPVSLKNKMYWFYDYDDAHNPVETCLDYFSHRDGHEQQVAGTAAEFTALFKRHASHTEFLQFYTQLPEEMFDLPFYKYVYITWMVNYFR